MDKLEKLLHREAELQRRHLRWNGYLDPDNLFGRLILALGCGCLCVFLPDEFEDCGVEV